MIFAITKPPVGYDLSCEHCKASRMFGDSSTALCLVSAAQLSSSPSSSPWRWIQVAGQEVASWTLALCATQHRPVSTNLTNNQTSTSQISLHEPHHIYRPKSISYYILFVFICLSRNSQHQMCQGSGARITDLKTLQNGPNDYRIMFYREPKTR